MTLKYQKLQVGYQLQDQFNDNISMVTSSYGTLVLASTNPWVPAVGDWFSTLNVIVTKWNDQHSGSVDASISSDGYLVFTAAAGTITSIVAITDGSSGGTFSEWMGFGTGGSEFTKSAADTVATCDNRSSKMFYPTSPILVARARHRIANSIGTISQTGRVVVTSGPQKVNMDNVVLNFDDTDYVTLKDLWDDMSDGEPFSLYLDRTNEDEYNESTNTLGYIMYRLEPDASLKEFNPQPLIDGFESLWALNFTGVHIDAVDIVTENDSL
jgi:hypothetical protein